MKSRKFSMDKAWQVLLRDLGISPSDLLARARLPVDLFDRKSASLDPDEYFRLWNTITAMIGEEDGVVTLVERVTAEALDAPLLACLCSADYNAAVTRLATYKPLIGPLGLDIARSDQGTKVTPSGLPESRPPPSFVAMELMFLTRIARLATREHIVPQAVSMATEPEGRAAIEAFLGTTITMGDTDSVTLSADDAARPFLTASESMWAVLEPALKQRMADLDLATDFRERVRACLLDMLAGGRYGMADVADRLNVSTRTLQRRLGDEGTTFQRELSALRTELATHYLANPRYSSAEISFLLGYNDPNSFIRAFHAWTGMTPETARAGALPH